MYMRDVTAMYEDVLRRTFHCGNKDDFLSLADSSSYRLDSNSKIHLETRIGLWAAARYLRNQINQQSKDYIRLNKLADKILETGEQEDIESIVIEMQDILNKNNIEEHPHQSLQPLRN